METTVENELELRSSSISIANKNHPSPHNCVAVEQKIAENLTHNTSHNQQPIVNQQVPSSQKNHTSPPLGEDLGGVL